MAYDCDLQNKLNVMAYDCDLQNKQHDFYLNKKLHYLLNWEAGATYVCST
jgi:hypothetical protein